jgi:hypothetical protein
VHHQSSAVTHQTSVSSCIIQQLLEFQVIVNFVGDLLGYKENGTDLQQNTREKH